MKNFGKQFSINLFFIQNNRNYIFLKNHIKSGIPYPAKKISKLATRTYLKIVELDFVHVCSVFDRENNYLQKMDVLSQKRDF